jgi:hypothetical protein
MWAMILSERTGRSSSMPNLRCCARIHSARRHQGPARAKDCGQGAVRQKNKRIHQFFGIIAERVVRCNNGAGILSRTMTSLPPRGG